MEPVPNRMNLADLEREFLAAEAELKAARAGISGPMPALIRIARAQEDYELAKRALRSGQEGCEP